MHITVKCDRCSIRFKVAERFAGKMCACPAANCDAKIQIPSVVAKTDPSVTRPVATATGNDKSSLDNSPPVSLADLKSADRLKRKPPTKRSNRTAKTNRVKTDSRETAKPSTSKSAAPVPRHIRRQSKQKIQQPELPDRAAPRTKRKSLRQKPAAAKSPATQAASKTQRPKRRNAQSPNQQLPPRRSAKTVGKKTNRKKTNAKTGMRLTPLGAAMLLLVGLGSALGLWSFLAPATQIVQANHFPTNATPADDGPANLAPAIADTFEIDLKPFLDQYCIDCHGPDEQMAGIGFHKYDSTLQLLEDRKTWERVYRIMNAGAMPPPDHDPQPSKAEHQTAVAWLDDTLNNFDCDLIDDPGRPTIRRLNIAEYNNTIRDLVGVDFQPAKDFPSDDVGEGFDNIGDVLSLSPLQLEKYLNAAEDVTHAAIVDVIPATRVQQIASDQLQKSGSASDGDGIVHINSHGQAFHEFDFPATGDYVLRVGAEADQAGDELPKVEYLVDDKVVHTAEIKGNRVPAIYEFNTRVTRGRHRFTASFINDYFNPNAKRGGKDRNLGIHFLEVVGPTNAEQIANPPDIHNRIVFCRPGDNGRSFDQAAKEVLGRFASKAYRRPVQPTELARLVFLAGSVADEKPERFDEGIRVGMQAILVSPHFLFRMESDVDPNRSDAPHNINDYELASRLSYFLWSSMPDEKLFELAAANKLNDPVVLEQQVRRMLRDSKSQALVKNFAQQWLNLRNLSEITPDPTKFKTWSNRLRDDMITETEMLFGTVMKEDRNLLDFLDADFTFVNERLAMHYGITKKVKGEKFQRVSLKGTKRAGVLTHASILTLTSNPTRTSPVKRGKWIMENILGSAPPPPPADVPDLEETAKIDSSLSLREQLAKHREDPGCAACHTTMDALGFGFENFDAVGKYRTKENKKNINAKAELPGGEKFEGSLELIRILKKRGDSFTRAMSEKALVYALGRGLQYYDKCAVDEIADRLKQNNNRFSSLIVGVVTSKPFRQRRGESPRDRE